MDLCNSCLLRSQQMLFPALPWEPCLYYNKAQPRSFLGQTSAAGHLLIVSSPEEHRDRGSRGTAAFLLLVTWWCLRREQTAVHIPSCSERRRGDSPWAGSPPGSRGADVIQQLFWQAVSPVGRAGHASPSASPGCAPQFCQGRAPGWFRRQRGWWGGHSAADTLLQSLRRIWIYCLEDLYRFAAKWIV